VCRYHFCLAVSDLILNNDPLRSSYRLTARHPLAGIPLAIFLQSLPTGLKTVADVQLGLQHIVAEAMAVDVEGWAVAKGVFGEQATLTSTLRRSAPDPTKAVLLQAKPEPSLKMCMEDRLDLSGTIGCIDSASIVVLPCLHQCYTMPPDPTIVQPWPSPGLALA